MASGPKEAEARNHASPYTAFTYKGNNVHFTLNQVMLLDGSSMLSPFHPLIGTNGTDAGL